jgi:hypothetical protein
MMMMIKFIPSVKIGPMEGISNTHTVFWYNSSFLLRKECEIKKMLPEI